MSGTAEAVQEKRQAGTDHNRAWVHKPKPIGCGQGEVKCQRLRVRKAKGLWPGAQGLRSFGLEAMFLTPNNFSVAFASLLSSKHEDFGHRCTMGEIRVWEALGRI